MNLNSILMGKVPLNTKVQGYTQISTSINMFMAHFTAKVMKQVESKRVHNTCYKPNAPHCQTGSPLDG
jgi:hypothetical protein